MNNILPDFVFMENVRGMEIYESDMFSYFTAVLKKKGIIYLLPLWLASLRDTAIPVPALLS